MGWGLAVMVVGIVVMFAVAGGFVAQWLAGEDESEKEEEEE